MKDKLNGRLHQPQPQFGHNRQQPQWKTTSTSKEDNLNGRQPQWKTTSMEDDLNGKNMSMEDNLN